MDKFFNIKCRESGLKPKCAVIVATVRALKMHGGGPPVVAGKPLSQEYVEQNVELVSRGVKNLQKHIENARKFGVNVVVAVNKFMTDTQEEIEIVKKAAMDAGAFDAVLANHWAEGGKGAAELGAAVQRACDDTDESNFHFLYDVELPIKEKIEIISKEIYGADGVDFSDLAASSRFHSMKRRALGIFPFVLPRHSIRLAVTLRQRECQQVFVWRSARLEAVPEQDFSTPFAATS